MTHFQKKSTEREKYYFAENNPGNHYLNQVMKVYSQWYYVNMICSDTLSWEGHFLIVFFPQTHNPSLIMRKASDNKVVVEGYFPGGPVAGTPYSQCMGPRFNPWSGNYSPHATTHLSERCSQQQGTWLTPSTRNHSFWKEASFSPMFSFGDEAFRKNNGHKYTLSKLPND